MRQGVASFCRTNNTYNLRKKTSQKEKKHKTADVLIGDSGRKGTETIVEEWNKYVGSQNSQRIVSKSSRVEDAVHRALEHHGIDDVSDAVLNYSTIPELDPTFDTSYFLGLPKFLDEMLDNFVPNSMEQTAQRIQKETMRSMVTGGNRNA